MNVFLVFLPKQKLQRRKGSYFALKKLACLPGFSSGLPFLRKLAPSWPFAEQQKLRVQAADDRQQVVQHQQKLIGQKAQMDAMLGLMHTVCDVVFKAGPDQTDLKKKATTKKMAFK